MKEVLILLSLAAILPLILFPMMRLIFSPRMRRSIRGQLLLKLLMFLLAALAVAVATAAFRWAGVTGNSVLVVGVLYAYGVYVLARQRYA